MPGCTTQSRSLELTATTEFKSRKSTQTPPNGAFTCPSSEVPAPKAMTGRRWLAHIRTRSCTSSVDCGNTTASGGSFGIHVAVLACCSRTACDVTSRLPNFAASAAMAAAIDAGLRPLCLLSSLPIPVLSHNARDTACFALRPRDPILQVTDGCVSDISRTYIGPGTATSIRFAGVLTAFTLGIAGCLELTIIPAIAIETKFDQPASRLDNARPAYA